MNGYISIRIATGERVETYDTTLYGAHKQAVAEFQAKARRRKIKPGDVTTMIADKDGVPVIHDPAEL